MKTKNQQQIRVQKHGVLSSETSYFVCGTSVSSCLLVQRTSKHLGHNSSAHFPGLAINHAYSFSSFQLAQRTSRVKALNNMGQGRKFMQMRLCADFNAGPSKE